MKTILPIIAIIVTIISIIVVAIRNKRKNEIANSLTSLLFEGKYDEFDQLIESKNSNILPEFNKLFLKFNKSIMTNDNARTENYLEKLKKLKLSDREKDSLYTRAFHYYLNRKDNDNATVYYELLKKMNRSTFKDVDRYYDTYIAAGYKYLDISIKQLDNVSLQEKPALEMMISNMFANKNDKQNVEKYVALAEEHLKQLQQS